MYTNKKMDWQKMLIVAVDIMLQTLSAPHESFCLSHLTLHGYCWFPENWKKKKISPPFLGRNAEANWAISQLVCFVINRTQHSSGPP